MSNAKSLRQLLRAIRKDGWNSEVTGGAHVRVTGPDGQVVIVPATPSDHRAYQNARANLRRAGAPVPDKHTKPKGER